MMHWDERNNDKFRKALQKQWVDEALEGRHEVPVSADRLWQKIDRGLTREKLSLVKQTEQRSRRVPQYWAWLGAAAMAFVLVLQYGGMERPTAADQQLTIEALPESTLETLVSTHHEPLQTPSRLETPRCDQTRQSCMAVAFL